MKKVIGILAVVIMMYSTNSTTFAQDYGSSSSAISEEMKGHLKGMKLKMGIYGGLLFSSIGFYGLSATYSNNIEKNTKTTYTAVSAVSFILALRSFYKGLFSSGDLPTPPKDFKRSPDMKGNKFMPILTGSALMYLSLSNNPSSDLSDESKSYYNTGKGCAALLGFLVFVDGIFAPGMDKLQGSYSYNYENSKVVSLAPVLCPGYLGLSLSKMF